MEKGAERRKGPGRPRPRQRRVAADKGYSYPSNRTYLRQHGIGAERRSRRTAARVAASVYHGS